MTERLGKSKDYVSRISSFAADCIGGYSLSDSEENMKYILAHDFGTSGDKASLFSVDGNLIASHKIVYSTHYSEGGCVEQDSEDWWNAFCKNNKVLLSKIQPSDLLCVSFDGTYPNCLCVDKDGRPLHRAIIWQDTRSVKEAADISAALPPEYVKEHKNGQITPDRTITKLVWLKRYRPEVFRQTAKVLPGLAHYILLKITGRAVTDHRLAFCTGMLNTAHTDWADEVIGPWGIKKEILPEIINKTDIVGTVGADLADETGLPEGTPLVVGTGDGDSANIGAGMLKPGDAYLNGGTSANIEAIGADGKTVRVHPTSCSGASVSWMKNTFCDTEAQLAKKTGKDVYTLINETIASAPVGSHGVMFHPYLSGERATRDNPKARGSFVGVTLQSTRADILRSIAEGIGFNLNCLLQVIRDSGLEITSMPIVGGIARGAAFRQILADIMNVELVTFEYMDECAAVGAAVYGGMAVGVYEDETAVKQFMHVTSVTKPIPENHEKYKKMIPLFEDVYYSQVPIYEKMAELNG